MATQQQYDPLAWLDALTQPEDAPDDPLAWLGQAAPVAPSPMPEAPLGPLGAAFPGLAFDQRGDDVVDPTILEQPEPEPLAFETQYDEAIPGARTPATAVEPPASSSEAFGIPKGRGGAFGGSQAQNLGWLIGLGLLGGGDAAGRIVGQYGNAYNAGRQQALQQRQMQQKAELERAKFEDEKKNRMALLTLKERGQQQTFESTMAKLQAGQMDLVLKTYQALVDKGGADPNTYMGAIAKSMLDALTVYNNVQAPMTPMPMFGEGGTIAQRQASTAGTRATTATKMAALPGVAADATVKVLTGPDRVLQEGIKTRRDTVGLKQDKTDLAGDQLDIGIKRKMFPWEVKKTQAEIANLEALPGYRQAGLDLQRRRQGFEEGKFSDGVPKSQIYKSQEVIGSAVASILERFPDLHVPAGNIGSTAAIHGGTHAGGLAADFIGKDAAKAARWAMSLPGVDVKRSGYRATKGRYSSEPHFHLQMLPPSGTKSKTGSAAASDKPPIYLGVSSSLADKMAGMGVDPNVKGTDAMAWYTRWSRRGAFKKASTTASRYDTSDNGDNGDGTDDWADPKAHNQAMAELKALNYKYANKGKKYPKKAPSTGSKLVDDLMGDLKK